MSAVFASGKTYAKQSPALTEWYPPEIKPVRMGNYITYPHKADMAFARMCWWDGNQWLEYPYTTPVHFQHRCWCGLANDPGEDV